MLLLLLLLLCLSIQLFINIHRGGIVAWWCGYCAQ
jgi:hypothetical protein